MKIQRITYLSLGTNQGNKLENLQNAINLIADKAGAIQKISSVYKTASWGFESNDFYNICIKVTTYHAPERLMSILLKIENELGRRREDLSGYTDRNIDIDILLFDDEIIFSRKLIVPHSKMLERKFVLIPLAEIADTIMHPIEKKTLSICLKNCNDTSEVFKIDGTLLRPIPLSEKYNYIAIEGNIGAGKTSLATKMAKDFNAKLILERFKENPFLPKFYKDPTRFAFPLEMSFLADRYQQLLDDLTQYDLFKENVIGDYDGYKSLIFAKITLQEEEYTLYKKLFYMMHKELPNPDLYIYLYQNTERLLENIKKRGRDFEQEIEASYLQKINEGYIEFIRSQASDKIKTIDISNLDFVNNREDYLSILKEIAS